MDQCLPLRGPPTLWEDVILLQNPEILLGPEGHFWCPEAALDPEVPIRTRRLSKDPEVVWEPEGSSRPWGHI